MRTIGNIPFPGLKITVFETETRFPVQFEAGSVAQIYRFRRGGLLENLSDVKKLVDEQLCRSVLEQLRRQSEIEQAAQKRLVQREGPKEADDDLPEII